MLTLLNVVLPTFVIILIGFLLGKFRKINITPVVDVFFYIGLPALTFNSMIDKKIVLSDAVKVWESALIIMLGCGIVAYIIFKAFRQHHVGLYLPIIAMNTVNIPFPVIYLAYGNEGLAAATLFYIPNVLLVFTLGIYVLAGKQKGNFSEVFKVPALYAAAIGLAVNLLNIHVPELILKPLSVIGLMVIPLALIVLGCNLTRVKITSMPTTLLASFLRIGVGLILGLLVTDLLGLTGVLRSVIILDAAMPSAVNLAILATRYDNEADLISSVVFVTTLASLVVIPVLLYFLT